MTLGSKLLNLKIVKFCGFPLKFLGVCDIKQQKWQMNLSVIGIEGI